jgi:hypothetical protein
MKKIVVLIISGLFGFYANAQDFKIGLKAGADLMKLDGRSFKEEFAFGYQAGAFLEIGLSEKWGIQPEVLFGQVNLDTSSNFRDLYNFDNLSQIKLTTLKIPLMLNYRPNKFVALQVGPQYSILIDQNLSLIQNGKDAFKKGNFSLHGGLQLNISKLILYGRYGVGLSNLNDIDNSEKWKNQTIQIGAGFRF